jgi:hypothetical protein
LELFIRTAPKTDKKKYHTIRTAPKSDKKNITPSEQLLNLIKKYQNSSIFFLSDLEAVLMV